MNEACSLVNFTSVNPTMALKASEPTESVAGSAVRLTSLNAVPLKADAPMEVMFGLVVKSRVPDWSEEVESEDPKDKEVREESNHPRNPSRMVSNNM